MRLYQELVFNMLKYSFQGQDKAIEVFERKNVKEQRNLMRKIGNYRITVL